ncbi:hypothetical protein [Dyella psychrodurans]|nr:hypothetical protein [Dyella psychrodurans]
MLARWQGSCLWAVAMLVLSGACYAQSTEGATPDQEYQKLIQVDQNIEPLGEHPFGENISTYDGSTSFNVTDVSLRGNGPTITVGRSAEFFEWPDNLGISPPSFPFGNWDLDIPRIETLVGTAGLPSTAVWQTGVGGTTPTVGTTNRCSNFAPPPGIQSTLAEGGWVADEWWYGYNLMVPGEGKQQLMPRYSANTLSPSISGLSFNIVTKNNWMVTCGVTASDGGEGFLAIAPDGTRYTFAHLVYRPWYQIVGAGGPLPPDGTIIATQTSPPAQSAVSAHSAIATQGATPMEAGPGGLAILYREDALMYVTQIQDRFGNTLTYNYDPTTGYLSSITANDGREVDVTYVSGSPNIRTITAKASNVPSRTWTYTYGAGLTGVQLPDGSSWTYQGGAGAYSFVLPSNACSANRFPYSNTTPVSGPVISTATVTAPSGLTGTFSFVMKMSGRSYTPQLCWGETGDTPPFEIPMAIWPEWYVQPAITSEVISGAGMPTQTWTYSYSPANASWTTDACARSGTCPTTVYTDVTDPNGNDTRYTFSNRFNASEGQLLRADTYQGAYGGTLVKSVVNTYASATAGPWPSVYGADLAYRDNYYQTEQLSPLNQKVITQDGQNYTWQAMTFNAYAQPTDVKRYNDIAGQSSIEEATLYRNDSAYWVLGLTQTVTNVTTGEVESSNTYTNNDLLQTRSRFGQLLMTYAYNNAGQLASFVDGNDNATTLGNYYRGIPQAITYADGTRQSLMVDDLGQIRSITDQAGNTTSYDYNAIGRIAKITYPTNDETNWYPETFAYDFVGSERGITGNHWRRTLTQGDKTEVTYFDATLRPILASHYRSSDGAFAITTQTNYDWQGNPIFQSYPVDGLPNFNTLGTGTTTTYDALSRVTKKQQSSELGPLTTTINYLPGASQQVTDPKGNVTTTSYQVFDQPSYDAAIQVTSPEGVSHTITRDLYGNPTAITQSAQSTQFTGSPSKGLIGIGPIFRPGTGTTKSFYYDAYHRLCRTSELESGSTVIAYDDANNIDWTADGLAITTNDCGQGQVDDSVKTFHTYDPMNRLTVLEPPEGTAGTTYIYDAVGNVTHARSGIAHWAGTYNKRNMPLSESLTANGFSNTLRYTHDSYGNLSATIYPDGTNVSYAPDVLGRPTQAGSFASDVSYFPDGEMAHFNLGGSFDYVTEQNARQLLSHYSFIKGGTFALSQDIAYDADANITSFTDLVNGQRSKTLSYDGLNRVTQAQAGALWGTESYTYDALNNITSRTLQGQTITYGYDLLNHLTSMAANGGATTSLGYDTRGNLINKNGNTLVFDAKNQLANVPGFASYAYDAEGRRVLKQVANAGPSTYYFYTHDGKLLYQYDEDMAKGTSYVYLGNKLIGRNERYESAIRGQIDGVAIDSNDNAVLHGWACSSGLTQSIQVHMYLGGPAGRGTFIGGYSANQASEPAVASECRVSSGSFRFSIPLSATVRSDHVDEKIYVYGISPVGNSNDELGNSGQFTVPAEQKAPKAPTVTATKTGDGMGIAITWSTANGVTSYNVEKQFNEQHWTSIYNGSAATFTIHPAANGTYSFRVQACNVYGCGDWGQSTNVQLENVPSAPASISVPGASFNPVSVSWASSLDATTYILEQSINSGGWTVAYQGGGTSAQVGAGMSGGYVYRVRACNTYGCSGYTTSPTVSVTIPPTYAPSISVPGYSADGSYTVSWTGVNDANRYVLQEQYNGGSWANVQDNGATSWSTAGRGAGTYGYHVVACNNAGCGPWSGVVTETVELVPAAPTVTVKQVSTGSFIIATVTWDPVPNATYYVVQEIAGAITTQVYSGPNTTWSGGYAYGALRIFQVKACNSSGCSPWRGG